ncbi:hypothetical protein HERIO_2406 [Hepatospora eriocheir]|uniref:Uncharacterized protein n=1 Tax=Hepatospora eriocheir TaxID=1081669 RepID=A0A1X0Q717_9MICR|nr:hypothetical protein HERIO_2406 [Hepatospora eriocheir]
MKLILNLINLYSIYCVSEIKDSKVNYNKYVNDIFDEELQESKCLRLNCKKHTESYNKIQEIYIVHFQIFFYRFNKKQKFSSLKQLLARLKNVLDYEKKHTIKINADKITKYCINKFFLHSISVFESESPTDSGVLINEKVNAVLEEIDFILNVNIDYLNRILNLLENNQDINVMINSFENSLFDIESIDN